MTLTALLHLVEALCWCAIVFYAIAGYGAFLLRPFGLRGPSVTLAALSGVGVVIFAGGVLNLNRAVAPVALFVMVALGVAAAFLLRVSFTELESGTDSSVISRPVAALLLFTAVFFVVRVVASVHAGQYQVSDDLNFYLAVPKKMLALHQYAADPFSERRIMASLGGGYFLQTMVLVVLPLENLQMADRTLGLVLLAFVCWSFADGLELTRTQRVVFLFLAVFTPQVQFNLTFVQLPAAMFFGLVYIAANRRLQTSHPRLLPLLLGLVTGAVTTMKSTYLPHGVIFIVFLAFLCASRRDWKGAGRMIALGAAGTLAVMIPWMIASRTASGTYFYPSLGVGYHYSAYGLFAAPSGAGLRIILHKVVPFTLPFLLLFAGEGFLLWKRRDAQGEAILALSCAAFAATLLVGIATGGDSVRRYNYPCLLPALVLVYALLARLENTSSASGRWRWMQVASAVVTVLAATTIWGNGLSNELLQIPRSLRGAFTGAQIADSGTVAEYEAMQRALPRDGAALATVGDMFLLDFREHPILMADFPGAASLPPGWPSRGTGDDLGSYLLQNHVRYLIYAHAAFAEDDAGAPAKIADTSKTQWVRSEAAISYRSHQQYAELARSRKHVYDDGKMYVLDLAKSDQPQAAR